MQLEMSNDSRILIDRYPFLVYNCPYCREIIKTEEIRPKIEKVETTIKPMPVIPDFTPRQLMTTESVFSPFDTSAITKDIEIIDFEPEKEESILILLLKIILQLFFLYFLLRIGWMILTHGS